MESFLFCLYSRAMSGNAVERQIHDRQLTGLRCSKLGLGFVCLHSTALPVIVTPGIKIA